MHARPSPVPTVPGRTPYLDGLRGIAILLVVALHYFYFPYYPENHPDSWFVPVHHVLGAAWVGVDLFFVLSGFLLGGILLDHRAAPNLFPVFYLRRACRILPVYFLFLFPLALAPALAFFPKVQSLLSTGDIPPWSYPFFLQNLVMSAKGSWGETWISPTWSLAVEEQFYLLLPLLVRLVPLRRLPGTLFALCLLAPALRIAVHVWMPLPHAQFATYMLLPCRWDSLLLGVLVAWLIRNPRSADWVRQRPGLLRLSCLLLAASGLALAIVSPDLASTPMLTVGYTLFALLFASAILCGHSAVLPGGHLLEWSWLRWLGQRSYLLYLVHFPISSVIFHVVARHSRSLDSAQDLLLTVFSFAVCLVVIAVSWRFFEKPILDFARKFPYQPAFLSPTKSIDDRPSLVKLAGV